MHVFMSKLTYEYTSNEFLVTQRQKTFRNMYVCTVRAGKTVTELN